MSYRGRQGGRQGFETEEEKKLTARRKQTINTEKKSAATVVGREI